MLHLLLNLGHDSLNRESHIQNFVIQTVNFGCGLTTDSLITYVCIILNASLSLLIFGVFDILERGEMVHFSGGKSVKHRGEKVHSQGGNVSKSWGGNVLRVSDTQPNHSIDKEIWKKKSCTICTHNTANLDNN